MTASVAVGIVGYGYWGPNLARNFGNLAGARLSAVCDLDPARLARAAVDAVAHQVCDVVEIIDAEAATPLASIRADGGVTTSDLVMQTQADLLGRPVEVADLPEVSALGVADLARRRIGGAPTPRATGRVFRPTFDDSTRAARRDHWREQVRWLRSAPRS